MLLLLVVNYLDSIGNLPIYGYTSYNDAKGKELNKGLDLKGGINVILQISSQSFNGLLLSHPSNKLLEANGQMHEGITMPTRLGISKKHATISSKTPSQFWLKSMTAF